MTPPPDLRFAALDFETANGFRGSPCAAAVVTVDGGRISGRHGWLMRPPEAVDDFGPFNVAIHGIGPQDVADEPRFAERLPGILEAIGDRPIVAHNAAFDIGVLRDACGISGIDWPELTYTCSLVLARTMLDLPSYSLPYCAESIGSPLHNHHNPLADAEAAAELVIEFANRTGSESLDGLLQTQLVRWGTLSPGEWKGSTKRGSKAILPDVNPDADPDHFLYGQLVALTGALPSGIVRAQAWEAIAELGGTPQKGVTAKTTLLVLADLNPITLRPGMDSSAKHRKALALREAGHPIEIMAGRDFLALLDSN